MNSKKISFIICVNDEIEYSECKFYIDRLTLPNEFKKDIITIHEAPSMAAGYNAGMKNTDARYKVYLHQDVFIINKNFIIDLLNIFQNDPDIGIFGCIGSTKNGADILPITSWDTGKIYHNCSPMYLHFPTTNQISKVRTLDGLLLATQYDIPWREDIMDGWDFYDISQCMEFQRNGYSIVIPYQDTPWVYHDNQYSKMNKYHFYHHKYIKEYFSPAHHKIPPESNNSKELAVLKEHSRHAMEALIQSESRTNLHQIFSNPDNRGYLHLREYELISDIDKLEQENNTSNYFWETGTNINTLLNKLRFLKFQLKRLEFLADDPSLIAKHVFSHSFYAYTEVCNKYVYHSEKLLQKLMYLGTV